MPEVGSSDPLALAMWLMLQEEVPEDFVIATGEVHSVREFVEKAFIHVGKTIVWEGKDEKEVGRCQETGMVHVKVDPKYFRPTEVEVLLSSLWPRGIVAAPLGRVQEVADTGLTAQHCVSPEVEIPVIKSLLITRQPVGFCQHGGLAQVSGLRLSLCKEEEEKQ
ncbi:hypothetical protein NQZ68_038620 [Dissostichus eleginoides]|nr:hypothetical protein NQZ68_038620 [Dissostichus eleginoides]